MTKNEVIKRVKGLCSNPNISEKDIKEIVELTYESIHEGLLADGKVNISGVCSLNVKTKGSYKVPNPQNRSEYVTVPPKKYLALKISDKLLDKLNNQ